jgi:serpin B
MRRVVYSHDKLYKEKDNFIWITIDPSKAENSKWVKKYRQRTLPTVYFCTFDGKTQYKIPAVCTLNAFLSKLKKLKRKNKSAWRREKKKRDKKKAEEEKKAAEEKKDEEKKKKQEQEIKAAGEEDDPEENTDKSANPKKRKKNSSSSDKPDAGEKKDAPEEKKADKSASNKKKADSPVKLDDLVKGNSAFAFDLYCEISKQEGNIFFSPFSISTALAITYAGARGNTANEIAKAMHFTPDRDNLHPAMKALMGDLQERRIKNTRAKEADWKPFELAMANGLFLQKGYPFKKEFLALNKKYYGSEFAELDFKKKTKESLAHINKWISDKTGGKIKNLIPENGLGPRTRLALANAIYFKSAWDNPFKESLTENRVFHLSKEKSVKVPTMRHILYMDYFKEESFKMVRLPYKAGELAMLILVPDAIDGAGKLEKSLNSENLSKWITASKRKRVEIMLPKFKISSSFKLKEYMIKCGIKSAFDMRADFTGVADMTKAGEMDLVISGIYHKTFIDVNEKGTEASAGTGVLMVPKNGDAPKEVKIDRPFIFLIRDSKTGSILFMGRVTNPAKQ